jgi:hypothetical protein
MQLLLDVSVLAHQLSPFKHPSNSGSSCNFIPGLVLLSSLFDPWSFITASFAPYQFCTVSRHSSGGGELLLLSNLFQGPKFSDEVSFRHATYARQAISSWIHYFPGSFPSSAGGAP